jgi:hypothetical protein
MCGMKQALRKPSVQLCPHAVKANNVYSLGRDLEEAEENVWIPSFPARKTCKECPSPASPEEIYRVPPFIDMQMIQSLQKCNARWEAEVGIMQSIFSRSPSPSTSHISMQVANATNAPPTHHPPSKKPTEKDISDQLFVQVHPAFLPSFLPAITVTCSPPCKMQVYSRLELRDHMLHPHQQRARWSDNATTDFCFQPPMIMNHHLTHFDMQRKKCRQVKCHQHNPNIDSAKHRRSSKPRHRNRHEEPPRSPKQDATQKINKQLTRVNRRAKTAQGYAIKFIQGNEADQTRP